MVVFPNAKINLGLRVVAKREDGFHDLQTVFYPVPFCDVLEIIQAPVFNFTVTGNEISTVSDNLVVSAYKLLKKHKVLAQARFHLHKLIPSGGGLGGGSSDAAFALKVLNQIFNLGLDQKSLIAHALELGSDCPFFVINKPCIAMGRGEILEPVNLHLSNYHLAVITPPIQISTKKAFSEIKPAKPERSVQEVIVEEKVENWKDHLINDFEQGVFNHYPEIKKIKDKLYKQGASYASMTGTGSSVYGLFRDEVMEKEFDFLPDFNVWTGKLTF